MEGKVLIIEDEKSIVDILRFNLERQGYTTCEAYDGQTGLEMALSEKPDLILLDLMLPKMDGFEVCRRLREKDTEVSVIILTAREEENDKVLGLEIGADDYITKPYSTRELMARVKANIRRRAGSVSVQSEAESRNKLAVGEISIDLGTCEVTCREKPVALTAKEFELLKYLMNRQDNVISREELLEKVWNYEYYGDMRTVDVTVRRLREKIEENPAQPRYILTKRSLGYMFKS